MTNQNYKILQYHKPNYLLQFVVNASFSVVAIISGFLILFSYIYISTPVYGVSMQPTLNNETTNDTVYINLLSSFQKGDIVVIYKPEEDINIIKRVIATQGDSVNIVYNGVLSKYELYVNNVLQEEPYLYGYPNATQMGITYTNFQTLKTTQPNLFDSFGNLNVPQGQVFVLGDHRGESIDSSYDGPYDTKNLIGRVDFIVQEGQNAIVYFLNVFTPFHF